MERPSYLTWLIEEKGVALDNGEVIQCYKLDYSDDDETLNAWAIHLRRHYISDEELIESCGELEISPEEYLKQFVIPQKGKDRMAGTARSNGISEILFSDLLELSKNPSPKYTLQIIMYWIMGQHSGKDIFKGISRVGIFNPRLNVVYTIDVTDIGNDVIKQIEDNVICYGN